MEASVNGHTNTPIAATASCAIQAQRRPWTRPNAMTPETADITSPATISAARPPPWARNASAAAATRYRGTLAAQSPTSTVTVKGCARRDPRKVPGPSAGPSCRTSAAERNEPVRGLFASTGGASDSGRSGVVASVSRVLARAARPWKSSTTIVPAAASASTVTTTSPSLIRSPSWSRERSVFFPLTRTPLALPLSRMVMPSGDSSITA